MACDAWRPVASAWQGRPIAPPNPLLGRFWAVFLRENTLGTIRTTDHHPNPPLEGLNPRLDARAKRNPRYAVLRVSCHHNRPVLNSRRDQCKQRAVIANTKCANFLIR